MFTKGALGSLAPSAAGKITGMPLGSDDKARFLRLGEVAEILSTSENQIYALVRRGDLRAIKIGGRGQWRVERDQLEAFIAEQYTAAKEYVRTHPFGDDED